MRQCRTMPAGASQVQREKQVAAEAAVELVEDGMTVGLGTGSTVALLLPALARRGLSLRCVASSPQTALAARQLGLSVEPFGTKRGVDLAIDGADQVTPQGWLVKGGGGAHTREKVLAASAERFVVIVDSTKPVVALRPPVPLELLEFGVTATMGRLGRLGPVRRRDAPPSPDGGVIADYYGPVEDPAALAAALHAVAGVVEHGLFPPEMVWAVVVGRGEVAEWRTA